MNRLNIFLLAIGAFVTGTAELIVAGILNIIADDMHISIALAGQLVTAYSLAFAIGTPIVIALTSRIRQKKLLVGAMLLFIVGCLASFASSDFTVLLLSRLLLGLSAGVYTVVAFSSAAKLVSPDKMGSAVSMVALGISSAMVLGVPAGVLITQWWSWQSIFIVLAVVSLLITIGMLRLLSEIAGDDPVPLKKQLTVLRNPTIVAGLFIAFCFSTSSSMMYSYVTPYFEKILQLKIENIGVMLFIMGIFGVIGSRLGGMGVDKWGAVRMLLLTLAVSSLSLVIIPLVTSSIFVGLGFVTIWVASFSAAVPAIQTYFIQLAPQSSNLVLGLNTSILHLGVAVGAGVGGLVVDSTSTVQYNPWIAGSILALGLIVAVVTFSIRKKSRNSTKA
ncbi:MFS transporter [Paenibacillus psychroresistens]|uniref:MFS transporter n=1 Tax=Paenibacillus psychroresistens TaxID=1778678 RepID=A0A6B8RTV4_9BACL|nr:MFS transporter [Paenibacillus psychroresistens]QGQ99005.1 MFS transporter [Paenibacillus psychroresistens]